MILPVFFILCFASYKDIKTMQVPISLSFLIEILSVVSIGTTGGDIDFLLSCASAGISFLITITSVIFSGLGGADCLMATAIGINLGLYGFYAFMFGLLFSIPYIIHLTRTHQKKEYPFIPFLTLGYIAAVVMMIINGRNVIWLI